MRASSFWCLTLALSVLIHVPTAQGDDLIDCSDVGNVNKLDLDLPVSQVKDWDKAEIDFSSLPQVKAGPNTINLASQEAVNDLQVRPGRGTSVLGYTDGLRCSEPVSSRLGSRMTSFLARYCLDYSTSQNKSLESKTWQIPNDRRRVIGAVHQAQSKFMARIQTLFIALESRDQQTKSGHGLYFRSVNSDMHLGDLCSMLSQKGIRLKLAPSSAPSKAVHASVALPPTPAQEASGAR